jgi:hypothetical protein
MPHRFVLSPGSLAIAAGLALYPPAFAAYTTDPQASAAQLVESLLAPASGITVEADSTTTIGAARQNGRLLSFDVPQRPMAAGIGLSTGTIASPTEPACGNNIDTGTGAHAGISAARGWPTVDQAVLRFSFQVTTGMSFVSRLMLFGSDEYPTYLNKPDCGDGLLILVDGVDVASIDSQAFSLVRVAQRFGVDPDPAGAGATGWNGLTPMLRFTAALDPLRSVPQIEFVIADIADPLYDFALFLSGLQGLEPGPGVAGLAVPEPGVWALWAVGLAGLLPARRMQADGEPA